MRYHRNILMTFLSRLSAHSERITNLVLVENKTYRTSLRIHPNDRLGRLRVVLLSPFVIVALILTADGLAPLLQRVMLFHRLMCLFRLDIFSISIHGMFIPTATLPARGRVTVVRSASGGG